MTDTRPRPTSGADAATWDERITLQQAATISGLSYGYLRQRAASGELRIERMGARLNVTTRRWLDDYLQARTAPQGAGRPPKPIPADYQTPPQDEDVVRGAGTGLLGPELESLS